MNNRRLFHGIGALPFTSTQASASAHWSVTYSVDRDEVLGQGSCIGFRFNTRNMSTVGPLTGGVCGVLNLEPDAHLSDPQQVACWPMGVKRRRFFADCEANPVTTGRLSRPLKLKSGSPWTFPLSATVLHGSPLR